jgi:hypothetical protein
VALERQGLEILGEEKADELEALEDLGIQKAVLTKLAPDVKLDGKDEVYIRAAYDVAVANASKDALARAREAAEGDRGRADKDDEHVDADEARAKFMKETEQAFRKPTVGVFAK